MRRSAALACALLCSACHAATAEDTARDTAEAHAAQPLAEKDAAAAPQPVAQQKHDVEIVRASWPTERADEALLATLSADAQGAVAHAVVPVLVPADPELARNAKLVSKPTFFAWSAKTDDASLTVSLSSSTVVHRYDAVRPAKPTDHVRDGLPAWVLQNEEIWSVAWEEFGVWYTVELECSRPGQDARCESDAAVRAIVEGLTFVGPSSRGEAGQ